MERRYTDAEVAELLSAAAQRQSGGGNEGWTAEQVIAMAGELGIDKDIVGSQIAADDVENAHLVNTTEVLPSKGVTIGAPRNVALRLSIRGQVPASAIEDAAEDAKRSFTKVKRLEVRNDELVVDGAYPGVEARLYIESNPTHSAVSLSLDNRRSSSWIHLVTQAIVLYIGGALTVSGVSSALWFFVFIALFAAIGFGIGSLLTAIVTRKARQKAEKDFELISHRVARSASLHALGVPAPTNAMPETGRRRLQPGHEA